jgi:hypothetical protein
MPRIFLTLTAALLLSFSSFQSAEMRDLPLREAVFAAKAWHTVSSVSLPGKKSKIQVALLLDTSNSMDGLIDQAKSQLWKMVNQLATTTKNGQSPDIEIALYEYGNDDLNGQQGFIRQVATMTSDLDLISDKLFKLTTNGGSEYCGWVIRDAVFNLKWTNQPDDLRLIIIAGNEAFDQGPVNPKESVFAADKADICITTIFCGDWNEGANTGWKLSSDFTPCKKYLNINQDDAVAHIPTPYDDEILALNTKLNATYVAYGSERESRVAFQSMQDANAGSYGAANLRERAAFKAKKQYSNTSWDLVDARDEDADILKTLKKDELPPEMRKLDATQQLAYLDSKKTERENIRQQILQLEEKANSYVAEKQKELSDKHTLDNVIRTSVQDIARSKGFEM